MSEWRDVTLGEFAVFASGKAIKPGCSGPFKAYGSNGVIGGAPEARHPCGVIVGRVGAYCGSVAVSREPFWASDNTIVIEPTERGDLDFLYYLLVNADLNQHAGGSAQPLVTQQTLKALTFRIPATLANRSRIASILRLLDDLIENNEKRIELLEQMAREIYREWFVRFRYPGHEHATFVDSPLGTVPEGWTLRPLSSIATIVMGQSPPSEFYNDEGIGLPFHQGVSDFGKHFPTDRKYCSAHGRLAHAEDVLVSVRAPVGRLNIAASEMIIGRGLAAVRATSGRQALLFRALRDVVFSEEDAMGGGTIFKAIGKKDLESVEILVAPEDVAACAEELLRDHLALIRSLTFHGRYLAAVRDLLLPKLVTGQVDVSHLDFDELVGSVV